MNHSMGGHLDGQQGLELVISPPFIFYTVTPPTLLSLYTNFGKTPGGVITYEAFPLSRLKTFSRYHY